MNESDARMRLLCAVSQNMCDCASNQLNRDDKLYQKRLPNTCLYSVILVIDSKRIDFNSINTCTKAELAE